MGRAQFFCQIHATGGVVAGPNGTRLFSESPFQFICAFRTVFLRAGWAIERETELAGRRVQRKIIDRSGEDWPNRFVCKNGYA